MTLEITFMRGGVIAKTASEFFETRVDSVVTSQQRSTAKNSRTNRANVSNDNTLVSYLNFTF